MEFAYYLCTLTSQVANSFILQNKGKLGDLTPESDQKAALAMLGLALGKCFFTYVFSKISPKLTPKLYLHFTAVFCGLSLFIHLLVASFSKVKFF